MIAGMLYLGVMVVAFVPVFCVIIVLSAGTMVYLRFRNTQFQIFHPLHSLEKSSPEALSDLPPAYEIAITMPTGDDTARNTV